ncbi:MAG TPA: serine hydrolase domain-containing protein [Gemmatimonadaceae bacterium]|jgi:CubicO group peptidase (beta-lactamase class C family)|nr:serine hydrolase domain-containing protein [Gemmatimonadaceae bacterium]
MPLLKPAALLAIAVLPVSAITQTTRHISDAEVVRRVNAYIAPFAGRELSGTLLVARGNRVLIERPFGFSSYELGVQFTTTTPTNIASITKPLTDIIAARMQEEGLLSWRDTVAKWLPNYIYGSKMTVEQLINHRAGVAHRLLPESQQNVPRTAQEMVEIANTVPLLFEPGAKESYSSGGYAILAAVLERAGKQTYDQLLQHYVVAPVSAKTIRHVDSRTLLPGRAVSVIPIGDGVLNASLKDLSFLVGAGSVYTTPHDIFLVMQGLVSGKYGAAARTALVRDNGLHWNGVTSGFRAIADWYPADSLTVIYFSNLHTGAIDLMRRSIPMIAAGDTAAVPAIVPAVKTVALSPAAQGRIAGNYDTGASVSTITFASPSLALFGDRAMLALDDSTFFSTADYSRVRFPSDSTGAVRQIEWGPGTWGPQEGPRFPKIRK